MSARPGTAREAALLSLYECERRGSWSGEALKTHIRAARLDERDAALAAQLCYGVLQNRMLCDFYLDCYSSCRTKKMETMLLCILRLGVYQLLFLDRIPASAAVNESVRLSRAWLPGRKGAPGLVNGVLRAIDRARDTLPQPPDRSIRYSHPKWLVDAFAARLPEDEVDALLAADNSQPPTAIQRNPLRCEPEQLKDALTACGAVLVPHPWLSGCWLLSGAGRPDRLPAYQAGWFYVQDPAARLAVEAAGPKPGMRVLDMCAAPGGKSFAAAIAMRDQGEVVSCDLHPHRRDLVEAGRRRLGLECVRTEVQDGCVRREDFVHAFDLVLLDAPCSGLGTIRKKPEIRYKDPAPLADLPALQSRLLCQAADYVRPGGVILYSTCTLLARENEEVISAFLAHRPDCSLEEFTLPGPAMDGSQGQITLWPHRTGTDGFYIARVRRQP